MIIDKEVDIYHTCHAFFISHIVFLPYPSTDLTTVPYLLSQAQTMTEANSATSKNISCLLYGPGDARFEEHPIPTITDPYDVLVRIHYVGVCGSDVGV
jgi:hypothetical protein